MSIESTLFSVLSSDATIQGYVSSGSPLVHRIYPLVVPDEAPAPFIHYHSTSTDAYNKLGSAPDKERKEFELGIVSKSFDEALAIVEAIKAALGTDYGYLVDAGQEYYEQTKEFRIWLHWSLIG
jgi:L-alanine-DL-glutamate epimerase-like enolase superfamily enzyme